MRLFVYCLLVSGFALAAGLQAQEANYDESQVPAYSLPDPLLLDNQQQVTTAEQWNRQRRPEILHLFETQVYGQLPDDGTQLQIIDRSRQTDVLGGDIVRKMVTLRCSRNGKSVDLNLLIYLPQGSDQKIPTFVGLNFHGNHTISDDPEVPVTSNWVRNDPRRGNVEHRAGEQTRGTSSSRWPIQEIISRGYGVATMYCGDIDPDFHDGFQNGVHALYSDQQRTDASWGTISAWACGLSRAMDYFEQDPEIDEQRVIVMGHSRLGKTALWAGARDERFALVVSNNSGCGGAALSRRRFGETVRRINTSFPHWFCDNFKQYNDREDQLPVDQHMLIALIAPRPVLVCSAEEDRWADPRCEFLSAKGADPVYRLLGTDGMAAEHMPPVNTPITSRIGYHIRPGRHDVTLQDWTVYMDFADKHLEGTVR